MNVILTGATGFVGASLLRLLLEQPDVRVTAVVRPGSTHMGRLPAHAALDVVELAPERWSELPERVGRSADVFVHGVWRGTRGAARNDEALQQQNVEETKTAFRAACGMGCSVFVGMGSQAEYGPQKTVTREDTVPAPDTAYGRVKLTAFRYCMEEGRKHGVRVYWPRIFSAYGPGDFDGTLLMQAARKMRRGEDAALTACTQMWDFVYVDDVARAMFLLMRGSAEPGAYNIASGDVRVLRDYMEEMRQALGSASELQYGAVPSPAGGLLGICPCIDKLTALGWRAQTPFRDGVRTL